MRLIDVDAAKKAVHDEFDECLVWDESGKHTANVIEEILEALPTVDAVPVTRCKDCKHNRDGICGWHYGTGYRWVVDDDDDFCSVGERKDEYVTLHHEDIHFIDEDAERAFYESLAEGTRSFTDEELEFYKKVNREKMQKTNLNIYDLLNKKEE